MSHGTSGEVLMDMIEIWEPWGGKRIPQHWIEVVDIGSADGKTWHLSFTLAPVFGELR